MAFFGINFTDTYVFGVVTCGFYFGGGRVVCFGVEVDGFNLDFKCSFKSLLHQESIVSQEVAKFRWLTHLMKLYCLFCFYRIFHEMLGHFIFKALFYPVNLAR